MIRLSSPRSLACVLYASMLAACGGGGGGGGFAQPTVELVDDNAVAESSTRTDQTFSTSGFVDIILRNFPDDGLFLQASSSNPAVADFNATQVSEDRAFVEVVFEPGSNLDAGTYTGALSLEICFDEACNNQINGSPLSISTRLIVEQGPPPPPPPPPPPEPEADPDPLAEANLGLVQRLAHNVVDAKYSQPLDVLVMISSSPTNSVYVYDPATDAIRNIDAGVTPLGLSISPNGQTAAFSDSGGVSTVDLVAAKAGVAVAPQRTVYSGLVRELLLSDNRIAYLLPINRNGNNDGRDQIVSLNLATGVSTTSTGFHRRLTSGALHPDNGRLYLADSGVSPADVSRVDVDGSQVGNAVDTRYHGGADLCSGIWLDDTGDRIISACGGVLRTDANNDDDLLYDGALPFELFGSRFSNSILAVAASHSDASGQLLTVERRSSFDCDDSEPCPDTLGVYDGTWFARLQHFTIPPRTVQGVEYHQTGEHLFHTDGGQGLLISRLPSIANPEFEYFLSRVTADVQEPQPRLQPDPGPYPGPTTDPDAPPLEFVSRTTLSHNTVDVAWSKALDRLVLIADYPRPALHVRSADGQQTASINLPRVPRSLSLSPDGLSAVVAQDAVLTQLDLSDLANGGSGTPQHRRVPIPIGSVVHDGSGFAHAFPQFRELGMPATSLNLASGEQSPAARSPFGSGKALLARGQNAIYFVEFSGIDKFDIASNALIYTSNRFPDSDIRECGSGWIREEETQMITACGSLVRLSADDASDLEFITNITLSQSSQIASVSHREAAKEFAVIEQTTSACGSSFAFDECRTRLALFEDNFVQRTDLRALPGITVDSTDHVQRGLFAVHDTDGQSLFLISSLIGDVDPAKKFYLTRVR